MPWEWIVLLIIAAALLFLAPSKLPELMRTVGRAWGEFRKGKMQVEREIREMEEKP
jgi:sec-independent protein translocase protein TatA